LTDYQTKRQQGRRRTAWMAAGFAVLVLVAVIYSSFGNAQNRVEVCITFHGRQACRTARAKDRPSALRTASDNTCAQLASGMSEVNQCSNTPPDRVTWLP
jgi:hypothetical protein